jgi:hypothetical protein
VACRLFIVPAWRMGLIRVIDMASKASEMQNLVNLLLLVVWVLGLLRRP